MANELEALLASSEQVTSAAAQSAAAQVSEWYSTDLLWAVAARAVTSIDGAKMYPGRDGNQLVFISDRAPNTRRPNRRGTAAAVHQVTIYKSGSITFNNVAVIDESSLSTQEVAAGQLLAHNAKQIELTPAEVKGLQKVAFGEVEPAPSE